MLIKELKYGEGVEFDLSDTEIKTVRVFAKRGRADNAVKFYIEADKSIPVHGIKPCQDGQRKGE